MQPLPDRVLRAIRAHALIRPGDRVVTAVSGGPDSVALLYVLHELARPGRFSLVGVGHFNHRLRGAAADADERFCRELAARLGCPIAVGTADVRALARDGRTSVEAAARDARYGFLELTATRMSAHAVAVGHTRDDQAETFVLKLLRGAGPRGLGGIYPRRGRVVRPLLGVSRTDLRDFLAARRIPWCEDETNRDLANPRNRLRHQVLPLLARLSPGVSEVLAREAEIARDDADWLECQAGEVAERIVTVAGYRVELDVPGLLAQPPAIARRVALGALRRAAGGRFIGFAHVEAVLALARAGGGGGRGLDLPGQRAQRAGESLILVPGRSRRSDRPAVLPFRYELPIPGQVHLTEARCVISAHPVVASHPSVASALAAGTGAVAVVEATDLAQPLLVRSRRAGDAFRPLGLGGRKKLQDFFVDRKVARVERDAVPIVVDARDRIVWVVGSAIADDFRITDRTRGVIILKAKRLGGAG